MVYNTFITSAITLDPPIAWTEIGPYLVSAAPLADGDVDFEHRILDANTEHVVVDNVALAVTAAHVMGADGTEFITRVIDRIVAADDEPFKAYDLTDCMNQILRAFGQAPDGTPRVFGDHLDCQGEDGALSRVYVRDGRAIEVGATITYDAPAGELFGVVPAPDDDCAAAGPGRTVIRTVIETEREVTVWAAGPWRS